VGYLDGLNRYAYVGNNPVNFTDPTGLLARRVAAWLDTQTGNYFSSGQFADTLGRTVDAFGAAAQGNPLLGLSAAPAVGITQGIQAGSVPQIGFEVATTELPGLKAGVGLVGAIIKSGSKIEPVVDVAKTVPNPYGRLGGPAHQQKVSEIVSGIESRGLEPAREIRIPTPAGSKSQRYIDVGARDPVTGNIVETYQVGRQTKSGLPVSRERQALDDIEHATGQRPKFEPYNQ
jgi:hypothetical protein